MPTVDAHQHFWQFAGPFGFDYRWLDDPAKEPIRRDRLPSDLAPLLQAAGIERTIVVQTQHDPAENFWALALAEAHPFIAGVVGWVDLASPACERRLLQARAHPKFVGVRHITQDEPDDDFITRPEVIRGLRVLERHDVPFDLLFHVRHLRHVPELARRLPDLRMVIDHMAKPEIRHRRLDGWLDDFRASARFPNVFCKVSGLVTEADWSSWTVDDLRPYVRAALDLFGPERLMYGSDWPVCELAGSHADVYEATIEALGPLSPSERQSILGGTATRFYGLAD